MTDKNNINVGFNYSDTEIIFGLVCPIGTEHKIVIDQLTDRLKIYNYNVEVIKVSTKVIRQLIPGPKNDSDFKDEYERITHYIEWGNAIRSTSSNNSILSLGIASEIYKSREIDEKKDPKPKNRTAYIIDSLKHPEEIEQLREIYNDGFYLIGITSDENRRINYLKENKNIDGKRAIELIKRDESEIFGHGQHTREVFQMSDFFVHLDNNIDKTKSCITRIIDLIFGFPYITPTFDEYAMFMAFTSALRSGDLSRQVGAVIARNSEILSTGANDCPRAGGGLYWSYFDEKTNTYKDDENGRDYKRGHDSNKIEQKRIIENILENLDDSVDKDKVYQALNKSKIKDITEYGRVVHAEMEALLFCSRNNISTREATLYCTTFPCHNCAKHIIAAGIKKVIFIEPYPKSKAFEFYQDSITKDQDKADYVHFTSFMGVGPRKFFDLFSMDLSSGYPIKRKNTDGKTIDWNTKDSKARLQMLPYSYLDKEAAATYQFSKIVNLGGEE